MRRAFCDSLVRNSHRDEFVFLTGDLGYGALEPLRASLGARFINAGVAEQNMVSVAAGMARNGTRPWVYSIAPFLYARAFEQIRNDVCMHRLPVVMVGNGGGYGYGVMGATHHALEDYGVLLTLSGMRVMIPAFDSDVPSVVDQLFATSSPTYLRLGLSEEPKGWSTPPFAGWRKMCSGSKGTIVAVGPLAGGLWGLCESLASHERPNLWCVSELPINELPKMFLEDVRGTAVLCVAEEHVASGSVGSSLASQLGAIGCWPKRFVQRLAIGYPSGRYGSQQFHRRECGLDPAAILASVD